MLRALPHPQGRTPPHNGISEWIDGAQQRAIGDKRMTNWTLAARAEKMNPSVIREILKVTEKPGIISLAGGLPSPKTFPVQ